MTPSRRNLRAVADFQRGSAMTDVHLESSACKSGHCLCGRISFSYDGEPSWACYCHCDDCTRNCASPVTAFLGVPLSGFQWLVDSMPAAPRYYSSSPGVKRFFCDQCGTPMAFQATHYPGEIHLYAATLDNPETFTPAFHVHHASHKSWLGMEDMLKKYPHSAPASEDERNHD